MFRRYTATLCIWHQPQQPCLTPQPTCLTPLPEFLTTPPNSWGHTSAPMPHGCYPTQSLPHLHLQKRQPRGHNSRASFSNKYLACRCNVILLLSAIANKQHTVHLTPCSSHGQKRQVSFRQSINSLVCCSICIPNPGYMPCMVNYIQSMIGKLLHK